MATEFNTKLSSKKTRMTPSEHLKFALASKSSFEVERAIARMERSKKIKVIGRRDFSVELASFLCTASMMLPVLDFNFRKNNEADIHGFVEILTSKKACPTPDSEKKLETIVSNMLSPFFLSSTHIGSVRIISNARAA
jgi:hypothetical protein